MQDVWDMPHDSAGKTLPTVAFLACFDRLTCRHKTAAVYKQQQEALNGTMQVANWLQTHSSSVSIAKDKKAKRDVAYHQLLFLL